MNALDYIVDKYEIDVLCPPPIEIPNVGRNNLAEWLHDLDFRVGVEIGVDEGKYSEIICEANPQMKMYGVDPYELYRGYTEYETAEELKKAYEEAKNCLSKFPKYIFVNKSSMDAVKNFADGSLDFVYIDANHADPYITWDIEGWSKKVKSGGIVSGHDYTEGNDWKVVEAVNKHINDNHIKPWFILGLENTIPGTIRDDSRSWMWVKKI